MFFSGRYKKAVDWAVANHLWGHALLLSSKMERRDFSQVTAQFVNTAVSAEDPLRTFYQIKNRRQPPAVTVFYLLVLSVI